MAREIAPTNQWPEQHPQKVGGRAGRLYPVLDPSGVWGWTDRASEAGGITVLESGVLGADDYQTAGGLRVFGLGAVAPLFAIGG